MEPLRADDIIDRQRLRRKVTFWRVVSVVAIVAGLIGLTAMLDRDRFGPKTRDHIARIQIDGVIDGDKRVLDLIADAAKSDNVKGAIIAINSPGGTTAGSEAVYDAIRDLAEGIPVTAHIGTIGASGGYMVAAATDHIVARHSAIVGSIGVIVQYPNITGLLESWGIDVRAIKSSPLKAEPSFVGEPPPGAEAMLRALVLDSYEWFKDLVAERRGFDTATIDRLADGSVFSGRVSLDNGLVDGLGGEEAARDWLTEQGLDEDLRIVTWEPRSANTGSLWLAALAGELAGAIGVQAPTAIVTRTLNETLLLDGLVSLWHAGQLLTPPLSEP